MKILVTGATGQVALSLAEAERPCGRELVTLGRPLLDLADQASVERAIAAAAPALVVNAGAYTAVDRAEDEVDLAIAINGRGAGHVAEACAARGISLIHISTDYVFDGSKAGAYLETDPTAPIGVYGRSKLEGEERVIAAGGRHVILRTSWVHSPFGTNFVKTMLRLAASKPELGVVSDQRGCPTYAPHLASAILAVAERLLERSAEDAPSGIYHAAGAGETTWHGLATEVFRQSAARSGPHAAVRPISTAEYPTRARRPANSVLDCTRLAQGFHVVLPDWRDGVGDCVARLLAPGS